MAYQHTSSCLHMVGQASIKAGRKPILNETLENELVWYIKERYSIGLGVYWREVSALALSIAQALVTKLKALEPNKGRTEQINQLQSFKATKSWRKKFQARHSHELTSRRTEFFDSARAANNNAELMQLDLSMRKELYAEVSRLNGGDGSVDDVKPQHISNFDEAGFTCNPDPMGKIAAPVGRKECQSINNEHGVKITGCLVIRADGRCAPPLFILPGKRPVDAQLNPDGTLIGVEQGSLFAFADKGNMTDQVSTCVIGLINVSSHQVLPYSFLYLQTWKLVVPHMIDFIRKDIPDDQWVILTLDQYGSHTCEYGTLKLFAEKKVKVYCPPSHSSHYTQPLDVSFFGPLKQIYSRRKHDWSMSNLGEALNKWTAPAIVQSAITELMAREGGNGLAKGPEMIKSAFRKAGLMPLDQQWLETNSHLLQTCTVFHDGLESARTDVSEAGGEEIVLLTKEEGSTVAVGTALLLPRETRLHGLVPGKEWRVVSVSAVMKDVKLYHADPFHQDVTHLLDAFKTIGGGASFTTIWPIEQIVKAEEWNMERGAVKLIEKQQGTLPPIFSKANCTGEKAHLVVNHPKMEEACRAFCDKMGGAVDFHTFKNLMSNGMTIFGQLNDQAFRYSQLKEKQEKRRVEKAAKGQDGRSRNALGEKKSVPKVLNDERRLKALEEMEAEKAARMEKQKAHDERRVSLLSVVIQRLVGDGILTAGHDPRKKPSMEDLKKYINKDHSRINAFKQYKNKHSLSGATVGYIYYFDYIHGGDVKHPTLTEGRARPLAATDADLSTKAPANVEKNDRIATFEV